MKYGKNYILKYIQKKDDKIIFDIMDEDANNMVLDGTMEDLNKILQYSNDLTIKMDFNALQESIFNNPIVFIAKPKGVCCMDDLNFNI